MNRHILAGVVVLLAVAALGAQAPGPVEKELMKLENDWSTAWQRRDVAFLQKLFAEEYCSTDSDGAVVTKTQEIGNITAPSTAVTAFVLSDLKVAALPGVACLPAYRGKRARRLEPGRRP